MTTFGETNHVRPAELVNDTNTYVSGDVVGGLLTFNMSHIDGTIHRLLLIDSEAKDVNWTLYLYDEQPSSIADNDPFLLDVDDLDKECGKISILAANKETINSIIVQRASIKNNDGMPVLFNGNTVWAFLVIGGAATFSSDTALRIKLTYWPDKAVE